jgi:hypothetical protein
MKKIELNQTVLSSIFSKKQLFLMLNWTFILTFLFCLRVSAESYSQNKRVTVDLRDVKLKRALSILEQKGDIRLLYSEENLPNNKSVSLNVKDTRVIDALQTLLEDTGLNYKVLDNGLIVIASRNVEFKDVVVKGQVTDANGVAIAGVNVMVKGATSGTVSTDAQGRFAISSPESGTLVFSFIGFATQEVAVNGRAAISVQLVEETTALTEVVVTALGIEKNAKSLAYSTQRVEADELNKARDNNFVNSIAGKSAGVVITRGTQDLVLHQG